MNLYVREDANLYSPTWVIFFIPLFDQNVVKLSIPIANLAFNTATTRKL